MRTSVHERPARLFEKGEREGKEVSIRRSNRRERERTCASSLEDEREGRGGGSLVVESVGKVGYVEADDDYCIEKSDQYQLKIHEERGIVTSQKVEENDAPEAERANAGQLESKAMGRRRKRTLGISCEERSEAGSSVRRR
jgi:hypothetical protein